MKSKLHILFSTAMLFVLGTSLHAQVDPTTEDTVPAAVARIQSEVDNMKKLKISGYVQAQFQYCDSNGVKSFAGGDFAPGIDKRFTVRRGRLKVAYVNPLSQFVVQIDATERGVSLTDAYVVGTDPWMRAFSLTAGVFNRPFGYEIGYSSSMRETPERGRMSQIIMPGERDLGAMVTFQMPKESAWNWFKIQGGFFNGTGRGASDFDTRKDFIGQLVITRSNKDETFKYSGGVSYYNGGERQFGKKVDNMGLLPNNELGFIIDSSTTNIGHYARREYVGADIQLSYFWVGGITTLRGEYIQGYEPGTSSSSSGFTSAPSATAPIYNRQFNGAYFYFIQNIMQTKHQIVVKYDWYDPNTEVSGTQIKSADGLTSADVMYTTIGVGYVFHWDQNIKLTAYYDMVTNESTSLSGFTKDVRDNVFTFRMQYKF